jgi:PAS domain S-box-containing protein
MEMDEPLRVLVIEDDADAQANLQDILKLDGHHAEMVATAAEALSRPDWPTYSAIILDWTLPDGTAETLLPELRRLSPQAAVVVVTGTVGLGGTIAAIRHEVVDYIIKPLDVEDLRAALWRIAERRRLAVVKARSEAAFRALVDAAPCAIFISRPDRTLVYISPRATQLIGYTPAEVLGKDYFPLLIRDTVAQQRIDAEVHTILAGGSTRGFEHPVWCKDGSHRWFVWNAERLDDYEGGTAVLAVGLDISARRVAEQRLRAEHATARVLAESMGSADAVPRLLRVICESLGWVRGEWWEFDADKEYLRCRQTWYSPMTGAAEFEAFSRPITFAPGEGLPGWVWATGKPAWVDDLGSEARSTRAQPAMAAGLKSAFAFPVPLQDRPLGVLAFFSRDVEPSDPDLLSCMASLGSQIGQFLARLRAEERALTAERLVGIDLAMHGLIHEGRNALQRAQACLEMLAMEVEGQETALALLARLQQAQGYLHNLYQQVSEYAAPLRLDCRAHHLDQILAEAWDELTEQRKGRQTRLRQDDGGLDIRGLVDRAQLLMVFRGILDNALAAVTGMVEVEAVWSETLLEGRPALQLVIRDNGPGLSAQAREKVFQPFNTTKTHGIGLGLATAKRVVEAHGGKIALGTGDRVGTELVVTLPCAGPAGTGRR